MLGIASKRLFTQLGWTRVTRHRMHTIHAAYARRGDLPAAPLPALSKNASRLPSPSGTTDGCVLGRSPKAVSVAGPDLKLPS